jgi:hypothetical protein
MDYKVTLRKKYNWNLIGNFSVAQQKVIWDAASALKAFLDKNTGRHGKAWLKENIGRVNFYRGGLPQKVVTAANGGKPTSVTFLSNGIWLELTFEKGGNPIQHVIHEVAHVIDNTVGRHRHALLSIWFGHGPSDELSRFLGGNPRGLRWQNGTCGVPLPLCWPSNDPATQYGYGNHSSADFFAEAFSWTIINPYLVPSTIISSWINALMKGIQ